MGDTQSTGMVEVEAPRRLKRWVDRFSTVEIKAIAEKLSNGTWLSDESEICESRSQAYYRAEALIERIVTTTPLERYQLERRTWPVDGGQRWAIRTRKE